MDKVYLVFFQEEGLDHVSECISAHRTSGGAVKYIKEELGFSEIEDSEGRFFYCDQEELSELPEFRGSYLYGIQKAFIRGYELKD